MRLTNLSWNKMPAPGQNQYYDQKGWEIPAHKADSKRKITLQCRECKNETEHCNELSLQRDLAKPHSLKKGKF